MEIFVKDKKVHIILEGDFNYPVVQKIEKLLNQREINSLSVEIPRAKVVDSEAIKFLYFLDRDGVKITVVNPPDIFNKILSILELTDKFKNLKIYNK